MKPALVHASHAGDDLSWGLLVLIVVAIVAGILRAGWVGEED